jgi:hypothetical protein
MKKLKIGKLEVQLMEDPTDINSGRYNLVERLMTKIHDYADKPNHAVFFEQFEKQLNLNSIAGQHEAFYNYKYAFNNPVNNVSTWEQLFALITVEQGEDQNDEKTFDLNYLTEKITRYRQAGMTAAMCQEEVKAFFLLCPELYPIYSLMNQLLETALYSKLDSYTLKEAGLNLSEILQESKDKLVKN